MAETLHDALDSLGLRVLNHGGMQPGGRAAAARMQLTFVGVPFGAPVTMRQAWALVRLLRSGHPAAEHTLTRAVELAADGAT